VTRQESKQVVTSGRFEIEQEGRLAYLDYTVAGNVLALLHTEVPHELRHKGLASELAESAFRWARDHHMKVDIVCPFVADYLQHHREYSDVVLK